MKKWDREADVVVVGFGGAGAAAALEAFDAGASVLILEKGKKPGGTTAIAGGVLCLGGGTPLQKALGIRETKEEFYRFLMMQGQGQVNEELQKLHVEHSFEIYNWIVSLGLEFKKSLSPYEEVDMNAEEKYGLAFMGCETYPPIAAKVKPVPHAHIYKGGGKALFAALKREIDRRRIPYMLNTKAEELITNAERQVIGIKAKIEGKILLIKARKAVILACGGYGHNKELVKGQPMNYLAKPVMVSTNTGDGVKMACKIGASLFICDGANFLFPAYAPYTPHTRIYVDKQGKRFVNEEWHPSIINIYWSHTAVLADDYFGCCIYDEVARIEAKLDLANALKAGIVKKADTIKDLAKALGTNPEGLTKTVKTWNSNVEAGLGDPEWGRKYGLKPIKTPPFYGCELKSYAYNEATGIRINADAKVIDVNGKPIPRLYAAGRVTGGQYGQLYSCGTAICTALIMGRIAGKNAGAEKAWHDP
jgi:3-oxo-5alpha-steroid 4-dehydrogenase